jgi:hypothetical protein
MGATGFSHMYFFNPKVSGKLNLSVSGTLLDAYVDTISPVDNSKFLDRKNKSTEANYIANYTVTAKMNAKHLIKAGATYQLIYFDANSFAYSNQYNQYIYELDVKKSTAGLLQGFAHWQFRPTDKITINSGVHYQNFLLNNTWALEPRLGARFQLTKKQNLNIAYGIHSQMQPTIYYFYGTYIPSSNSYYKSNRDLDLSRSQHAILSYDYNFAKNFRFKLEAYYQYLNNVPIQKNWNSSFSMINVGNALEGIPLVDTLVNSGEGENYGVEFTIEKFFSNHFYFLTTVSVYDSKYKDKNGVVRNTSYNGGYVGNALAGYELQIGKNKNKAIALDLKYTQAGGNRYTPIDIELSKLAGKAVYVDSEAFSKKQKDYSRFDVKLSYKTNRKKTAQSLFFVIENIFGTKNILRESYNANTQSIQKEYQLGLFYYFGYRIEF